MSSRFIAAVVVAVLAPVAVDPMSYAQTNATAPAEQEIRKLLRVWDEAYQQRDVQGLSRILADEFTITDATGAVLTKPQYLMSIVRTPDFARITSYASEDVVVKIDGDTATVTGRSPVKGRPRGKGQAFAGNYRFNDTWAKTGGTWKAVATKAAQADKP